VGVHPDHLVHAFRRQYHCTVGEYVRQLRIEFACRQITSSDMPLAEIAVEAGFADQSHFTKTFKRLVGMTPSEFQRHSRPSRLHTTR
jgi:AraC family transcriptional regulator